MALLRLWSTLLPCPGCGWRPSAARGCCRPCWRRLVRETERYWARQAGGGRGRLAGPVAIGPYRGLLGRLLRAAKYRPSLPLLQALGELLRARWLSRAALEAGSQGPEAGSPMPMPPVAWPGSTWLVVPVPPDPRRRRRRIDHAGLLAEALARGQAGAGPRLRPCSDALRRTRSTRPQAGLSVPARERNLSGAIEVGAEAGPLLRGARVLLVDDVLTSGATLRACSRALRQAGVGELRVAVLALARA